MPKKKSIAPSEGERRAQVGYVGQYRFQAYAVLRALREGTLEWIRVADPDAKTLDDFQMGSSGRVDAFQVKWSAHPGSITFNNLTTGDPSLLKQLVEGHAALMQVHDGKRVVAHLVANDHPSTSDTVPVVESQKPAPSHFSAFLKQVWEPTKSGALAIGAIPTTWKAAWSKFVESSGLTEPAFAKFLPDCDLDLDYRAEPSLHITERERVQLEEQVARLSSFFAALVASPEKITHLSKDELLRRLNWSGLYEFRNLHEFPVDRSTYQPLQETVDALTGALEAFSKGYLAVVGSPGSGKSTLTTETLRARPERVIKYYAFVRDDISPVNTRGESENFLHDVTGSLAQAGFRPSIDLAHASRQELANAFRQQLQMLGEDFKTRGRRTLFLIDGLDHVKREQAPYIDRDFFGDLPLPNQIPEGVIIILGTQTLAPLPPQIQNQIDFEPKRRIETKPLSRSATTAILAQAGLGALSLQQQQRVFEISGGHPLALHYVVELLKAGPTDIDQALESQPAFTGDIEDTYRSYWEEISEDDHEISNLFGLIARLRPCVDLSWIKTWANPAALHRLQFEFAHYFTREGERWFFFHNSFRRFLITITARSAPGEFSESENRQFHRQLAELCQNAPPEFSAWKWEQLYHLAEADEHELLLSIATQKFFREQFFDSRPARAILDDILLARRSLTVRQDPVAAVRLSLAHTEIWRRNDDLSLSSPVRGDHNPLLETGHLEAAVSSVRQGTRLLVSESGAIHWCADFLDAGHTTEARRIFELVDPLSAQVARGFKPQEDEHNFLFAWASAALHPSANFLGVDDVIKVIDAFAFSTEDQRPLATQSPARLRNKTLKDVGIFLIQHDRGNLLAKIEAALDKNETHYGSCVHQLELAKVSRYLETGDSARARSVLDAEMARLASLGTKLSDAGILDVAEIYLKLGQREKAEEFARNLERPALRKDLGGGGGTFALRFRYHRLKYALGSDELPEQIVAAATNAKRIGIVQFERALCRIAWIWAQALQGKMLGTAKLEQMLRPLLDFFDQEEIYRMDWDFAMEIQSGRHEFNSWLIDAYAAHGKAAIDLLCSSVAGDWSNRRRRRYWYAYHQRDFVTQLIEAGAERSWAENWLTTLEAEISQSGESASGRVSQYAAQVQAWLILGKPKKAEQTRQQMMRSSFGVGYRKDHQLEIWLRLVRFLLRGRPAEALQKIRWIAKCIAGLNFAVENGTINNAAGELIAVCTPFHPEQAINYFRWFGEKDMLWREEALYDFLIAALEIEGAPIEEILLGVLFLLIPYVEHGNWYLVERLIVKLSAIRSRNETLQACRALQQAARQADKEASERWLFGVARGALLAGIKLEEIGLSRELLRRDASQNSGDNLSQADGAKTIDELEFAGLTPADFKKMKEQMPIERQYFNWQRLIRRIAHNYDKNDLLEIVEVFRTDQKFPLVVEAVADRLLELGALAECRSLAYEALEKSRPDAWNRFQDGGTRLAAFLVLLKTDKEAALPLFYADCAIEDPLEAENFEALLPHLADAAQRDQIWREIDEHLQVLLEGCDQDVDDPPDIPLSSDTLGKQLSKALEFVFPRE